MPPAGFEHGRVTMRLARLLANHVADHRLGEVLGAETGFKLQKDPDTVRAADVSFVAAARINPSARTAGYWDGAPDLAVEVVSPGDLIDEVEEKVDDYLNAHTRLIWIVNPRRRTITIYRPDQKPRILVESDTLSGEDVIQGFECRVAEAFI